jgi:hypothetical protein
LNKSFLSAFCDSTNSSCIACWPALFERFLQQKYQIAVTIKVMTTTPPITPPAIAPVFELLGGGVEVGVRVPVDDDVVLAKVDEAVMPS